MSTPPMPPGSGDPTRPGYPGAPTQAGPTGAPQDPRYAQGFPGGDARWQREQRKNWERTQRQQHKVWRDSQRDAMRYQARSMRQQAKLNAEAQRAQARAWRRTHRANSLVGPLLLIAFAVVMLLIYSGNLSAPLALAWFSRWWPLILIGAGVVRIAEWGIARATASDPQVVQRFSVGGGTVALLILITALGFTSQGVVQATEHGFTINSPFLDTNSDDWRQFFGSKREEDAPAVTHAIAANGTLQVDNGHGDVTIDGTSDDGLLHVSLHKEVFSSSDNRAQKLLDDIAPQFSGSPENLSLTVPTGDTGSAALTLLVPRTVRIVVNSSRGDVHVGSLHAPVVVNSNRGDVEVASVVGELQVRMNSRHGELNVRSVQGPVQIAGSGDELNLNDIDGTVKVNGDFFGSGHLQHVSQRVDYDAGRISFNAAHIEGEVSFDSRDEFSANGLTGPVEVKTRSRDVTLSRISGDVRVSNSSGHVQLVSVPPTGSITVDNRDGDVSLSLPNNAHFSLNAETSDGSVSSDFPGGSGTQGQSGRGLLSTTVGSGGSPIRLTTTHGNINIAKNSDSPVAPLAPLPPLAPSLSFSMPNSAKQDIKDAAREAAEARREAQAEVRRGLAEAAEERQQALKEAGQARRDALKEAADARREAQKQATEARKEAEQARRDAQREADQARRDAQR